LSSRDRHRLATVLALAVCAVLAGARSYVTISEWAHDLPLNVRVRLRLTLGRATPSESTIRRILAAVDPEALDRAVSAWLIARATRSDPTPPARPVSPGRHAGSAAVPASAPRAIAVDGKSARGARHHDGRAVHLFAAFDTGSGIVLGQSVVDGKTNEITAFAPLLDRVDITDAIITADALCRARHNASYEDVAVMPMCWPGLLVAAATWTVRSA
jgi:hypothetical protein